MAARLFAKIETSFILTDVRYKRLSASAKVVYISLWIRAVECRSDTLPIFFDARSIRDDCSLDARTVNKCVTSLQQSCLIEITEDNRIKVLGVKRIHDKLTWKTEGEQVGSRNKTSPKNSQNPLGDKDKEKEK